MNQGAKIFEASLENTKKAARKVFEVKDSTWDETREGAFAQRRDGKRSYTLSFMERDDGTCEVRLSIDAKRGIMGGLRKKPSIGFKDELESIWKQMGLMLPTDDGNIGEIITDIRELFSRGGGQIKIPESFQLKVAPGSIINITNNEDGTKREIMIPERMTAEVQGWVLKVS